MSTAREQKLVDICFQVGLMISESGEGRDGASYDMTKWSRERKAEWIAEQLRASGFDTSPCGMSWGVLKGNS